MEKFGGAFDEYKDIFVQRLPRYAVKSPGRSWRTKHKPLNDIPVKAHLDGRYAVAVLGRWYPDYAILDIDSRPLEIAREIREKLGLDELNSMLFSSESPDSYHVLLRPQYHGRPPTLRLLGDVFASFCRRHGIEIYPQRNRPVRLPFGPKQAPLDFDYIGLDSWRQRLYWFEKLNDFDLFQVRDHQIPLDLKIERQPGILYGLMDEAQELFDHGLQHPSSRHDAQFKILYFLWRQNIPRESAERITCLWIRRKHNGMSRDFLTHPGQVEKEISRQADHIYNKYQLAETYPDTTHNLHNGFITRPDLADIVRAAQGSLPRMRFLFQLVRYSYPRRLRTFVNIHRDKLVEWASTATYRRYLDEFEERGILTRPSAYLPGSFSKDLKLNWQWRDSSAAVLYEGRSAEAFEDAVRLIYKPDEFRGLLIAAETEKSTASKMLKTIWEKANDYKSY